MGLKSLITVIHVEDIEFLRAFKYSIELNDNEKSIDIFVCFPVHNYVYRIVRFLFLHLLTANKQLRQ